MKFVVQRYHVEKNMKNSILILNELGETDLLEP